MKTKLTLFVAVLAAALFAGGCASTDTSGNQKTAKPEEPKEPAFVKNGLVAYYPFNGNAKDQSRNGNDGRVEEAKLSEDRHSNLGGAFIFDGRSSISVKHQESLQLEGPITITVWIKPSTFEVNFQRIVQKSNEISGLGYGIAVWTGNQIAFSRFEDTNTGDHGFAYAVGLGLNKWQQVATVWDNGYKIFLDGNPVSNGAESAAGINEVKAHPNSLAAAGVYGLIAMKAKLVTPKILHSPCDPSRAAANEHVQENWKLYDTKAKGVSAKLGRWLQATYLCRGADTMRPSSVYAVTRNWSADTVWAWANGSVSTVIKTNARTMSGLKASQGQVVTMDGGARQTNQCRLRGRWQGIQRPRKPPPAGWLKGQNQPEPHPRPRP